MKTNTAHRVRAQRRLRGPDRTISIRRSGASPALPCVPVGEWALLLAGSVGRFVLLALHRLDALLHRMARFVGDLLGTLAHVLGALLRVFPYDLGALLRVFPYDLCALLRVFPDNLCALFRVLGSHLSALGG